MRITVKCFLTFRKAMENRAVIEIDTEPINLQELLEKLIKKFGKGLESLVFESNSYKVLEHNQILINGQHYRFRSGKIHAVLKDGDVVSLIPPIVGG